MKKAASISEVLKELAIQTFSRLRQDGRSHGPFVWVSSCLTGADQCVADWPVSEALPTVLILTPMRNTCRHLEGYFRLLDGLDYPKAKITLGILEGDSTDGTYEELQAWCERMRGQYADVLLLKHDGAPQTELPRWDVAFQRPRRAFLAEVRNRLLLGALGDQEWVLWLDADLIDYPKDLIQRLLASGKEIAVPLCVLPSGKPFDLNTFRFHPHRRAAEKSSYLKDGLYQPPSGAGRVYLDSAGPGWVPVDGVGGTALLIRADLHRRGLNFPAFPYRGYIETEGLAAMAVDMGIRCWGSRDVVITHFNG